MRQWGNGAMGQWGNGAMGQWNGSAGTYNNVRVVFLALANMALS